MAIAKNHPEDLYKRNRDMAKLPQSMLGDFARTPEKDLPLRKHRKKK
jgi:hypothetical protein